MATPVTIKDYLFESRLFMRRTVATIIFATLLIAALVSRLVYLQVVAHEHYATLSDDNRIKIQPLPPNRGLIYDRNGLLLAENLPSYRLEITAELVRDMPATLQALGKLVDIRETDLKRFEKLRKRTPAFKPVPLRFHLSDTEVARFAVDRHLYPGVDIVAGLSRHYPHGSLAVHALGYVGRIDERDLKRIDTSNYSGTTHIGKVGIEKTYEARLHGKVGYKQVETNAEGRTLRTLERTPPVPGYDLHLTLDAKLQARTELFFGDQAGAAIVLDIHNGDVLAFVSQPGFDPNLFVNGIDSETYQSLRLDELQPLFNRALRGQYPPGSTIKPFVGLAGLETHTTTGHKTTYCPGYYRLPGKDRKYRDWKRTGHGTVNLKTAISQSCDVYFYDLALSLGIDQLHEYLSRFGFGTRTGLDISGEASGLMPSREWKRASRNVAWYPGETLITGIGQGFMLSTPVQLASATATLASFGSHIVPRIVSSIRRPDNNQLIPQPVKQNPNLAINKLQHWKSIILSMREVVHGLKGTAKRIAKDVQYEIAGKTGTAQVFGLKEEEEYDAETLARKLRDHSLFIAFAPVDNPRIAVSVIVEHGGSGSAVAAPIARKIMDAYFNLETAVEAPAS